MNKWSRALYANIRNIYGYLCIEICIIMRSCDLFSDFFAFNSRISDRARMRAGREALLCTFPIWLFKMADRRHKDDARKPAGALPGQAPDRPSAEAWDTQESPVQRVIPKQSRVVSGTPIRLPARCQATLTSDQ
jgi:hypothetical protein